MIGDLCVDCDRPATHERLIGMAGINTDIDPDGAALVVELVCEEHSRESATSSENVVS